MTPKLSFTQLEASKYLFDIQQAFGETALKLAIFASIPYLSS